MFAALHSEISVDNLLHGLIIDSANDAAIALGRGYFAGSEGAFATLMTHEVPATSGSPDLTFTNAWGRPDAGPEGHRARNGAARRLPSSRPIPTLYKIFGERDFFWNKIKQPNRNPLLLMDLGADGLKTGNIDTSGFALVGSAVQNGQRLIVAIYGARIRGRNAPTKRASCCNGDFARSNRKQAVCRRRYRSARRRSSAAKAAMCRSWRPRTSAC